MLRLQQTDWFTLQASSSKFEQAIMHETGFSGLRSNSRQVLFRILFRLVLLVACAMFNNQALGKTFATLLPLLAVFCTVAAAVRGESIFGRVLTHWDEAVVYAILGLSIRALV